MKKTCMFVGFIAILFVFGLICTNSHQIPYENPIIKREIDSSHFPVSITTYDSYGKPVDMIFTHKPQRVVADELNTFETLVALGLGDRIVEYSISKNSPTYMRLLKEYPEEMSKVKGVAIQDLNTESVLASSPDFILGWKSTFTSVLKKPTDWWNARGINTYVVSTSNHILHYGKIDDECQFLSDMGKIFDVEEKTNLIIQGIHDELARTRKQTRGRKKQFVMVVEMNGKAFMNYDDGWLVGDMVTQLGEHMPVKEKRISYEDLVSYNPDVLFVVYFNDLQKEKIRALFSESKFSSLKVVKEKRIYLLPFDHMYTTAIKTRDGIRIIRHGLYPNLPN